MLATQSLVVKRQSRLKYRIWDASNTSEEGEPLLLPLPLLPFRKRHLDFPLSALPPTVRALLHNVLRIQAVFFSSRFLASSMCV